MHDIDTASPSRRESKWTLWLTFSCGIALTATCLLTMAHPQNAVSSPVKPSRPSGDGARLQTEETTALPELPEPITSFGAAVVSDWLYVYSGHTGRQHSYSKDDYDKAFRRVNLRTGGAWEVLPMQTPLQGMAMVAHGGKVYRIGGLITRNERDAPPDLCSVDEFARFDPATKEWRALTPLPEPRSSHDAVVMGDKLYVMGGWKMEGHNETWHTTSLVADLSKEPIMWEALPEQPFRRRAIAAAELDGKVLVIGGFTPASKVSARVDIYDPQLQSWSRGPDVPTEYTFKMFGSSAFRQGETVYASGGDGIVYGINGSMQKWTPLDARLAEPRFFHRLLPWRGDRLLFVGGASKSGFLRSIESWKVDAASE